MGRREKIWRVSLRSNTSFECTRAGGRALDAAKTGSFVPAQSNGAVKKSTYMSVGGLEKSLLCEIPCVLFAPAESTFSKCQWRGKPRKVVLPSATALSINVSFDQICVFSARRQVSIIVASNRLANVINS